MRKVKKHVIFLIGNHMQLSTVERYIYPLNQRSRTQNLHIDTPPFSCGILEPFVMATET